MDRTYCALQLLSYCFCFFLLYFCFWLSAVLISLTTTSDFQSVSNCIVLCRKNRQNNMTELAHWRVQGDTPMMTIPRSSHVLCTDVCICPADRNRDAICSASRKVARLPVMDVPLICSLTFCPSFILHLHNMSKISCAASNIRQILATDFMTNSTLGNSLRCYCTGILAAQCAACI